MPTPRKSTYWLPLLLSGALVYACTADEGDNYQDAGNPIIGAIGGATTGGVAGIAGGGTTGGTLSGMGGSSTPGSAGGGTLSGTVPTPPGSPGGGTTGGPRPGTTTGGAAGTMGGATLGGAPAGTMGGATTDAGVGTGGAGGSSDAGTGPGPVAGGMCPGLPAVTNYDQKGPFDVKVQMNVVPGDEGCSLFRPGTSLGKDGLKHPIAVWGNGILTSPDLYTDTLSFFASHGFVLIACNSSGPEKPCLTACMDWLVKQNDSGDMAGKLDITKEITLGYSWGGGACIDTSTRPNMKATVSFHGMPPRNNPWATMKAPLLLFTSTGDDFVSASGYVTPNFNSSKVSTFYATLQESVDHLYILDAGGGAAKERGPAVAWMRYWVCGDQNAKKLFFGSDCTLCKAPWKSQSKPMGAFN